ncbi:phosphatidate cytidylyltransferase [Nematocida ausubeli]|nr:phosphatidate cytidylyltransferase [Nematocida ausubeli]KAI5148537.1 phosphatidate cytidylyltransferase [Nematocida ausubeli]KAI5162240.1 phosphatidate cytidylyltransferase [Nematocida ausubeli]
MKEEDREKTRNPKEKWNNLALRTGLSVILIGGFAVLVKMGRSFLIGFIILLSGIVFYEVLRVFMQIRSIWSIKRIFSTGSEETKKGGNLPIGFFWGCFFLISLMNYSKVLFPGRYRVVYHVMMWLQFAWILWFVHLLRGGSYRMKIFHLSMVLMTILGLMKCTEAAINNVNRGIRWFVYPCLLVAINDTFAYLVGKHLGQTPLTKLSPKKTVEGFLGGGIATVLLAIPTARMVQLGMCYKRRMEPFDALSLAVLASVIAPIGGILASGYKRAFNAKHFSRILPGHGGISDRIDCQLIMQLVSNMYLAGISRKQTLKGFVQEININLSQSEKLELVKLLVISYSKE